MASEQGKADKLGYETKYGTWDIDGKPVPVASTYRVAWRRMAGLTNFRTLFPAIIPPGTKHVDGVFSAGFHSLQDLVVAGGTLSSFICDLVVRTTGIANLFGTVLAMLPRVTDERILAEITERYLRLNCLTRGYAPLWEEITGNPWSRDVAVRNAYERLRVQTEIDALVGIGFGLDLEEILTIYRTQFPVMRKYDQERLFDIHGRLVPKTLVDITDPEQLVWTHPQSGVEYQFVPPFALFDREHVLQEMYARWESS